jgi:hypothetical protein
MLGAKTYDRSNRSSRSSSSERFEPFDCAQGGLRAVIEQFELFEPRERRERIERSALRPFDFAHGPEALEGEPQGPEEDRGGAIEQLERFEL